jgi:hypothetical protein
MSTSKPRNLYPFKLIEAITPVTGYVGVQMTESNFRHPDFEYHLYSAPAHFTMHSLLKSIKGLPYIADSYLYDQTLSVVEQYREEGRKWLTLNWAIVATLADNPTIPLGASFLHLGITFNKATSELLLCFSLPSIGVDEKFRRHKIGTAIALQAGEEIYSRMAICIDHFTPQTIHVNLHADFMSQGGEALYFVMTTSIQRLSGNYANVIFTDDSGY